jgi:hypothetical protein
MADPSTVDWLNFLLALGAGSMALFQYKQNSLREQDKLRREQATKAADEMEKFHNDHAVNVALRMIDWDQGFVTLKNADGTFRNIFVGTQEFLLALRHHSEPRDCVAHYDQARDTVFAQKKNDPAWRHLFSVDEQGIRDLFDTFLGRLERMDALIRKGVISPDDFQDYFSYWLVVMGEIQTENDKLQVFVAEKREALWAYIRAYEFRGVIRLFERYGRTTPARGQC